GGRRCAEEAQIRRGDTDARANADSQTHTDAQMNGTDQDCSRAATGAPWRPTGREGCPHLARPEQATPHGGLPPKPSVRRCPGSASHANADARANADSQTHTDAPMNGTSRACSDRKSGAQGRITGREGCRPSVKTWLGSRSPTNTQARGEGQSW